MKITVEEMQLFALVVDTGSLSAAAEKASLTPSAVSRTLKRLEEKLGATLMHRTSRRMALSEEGELFLSRARGILEAVEETEELVTTHRRKPAGRLRVDAASPFVLHALVPLVPEFLRTYPDIRLELSSFDRVVDLLEERTDVAIRIGALRDSTLHARTLGSSRTRPLASPEYLKEFGVPKRVEDLAKHRLLGFTEPRSLNRWPLRGEGGAEFSAVPNVEATSGETLLQLARRGVGIACLADFMTAEDVERGRLVPILEKSTIVHKQPIHAVYQPRAGVSVRIRCFLDFIAPRLKL